MFRQGLTTEIRWFIFFLALASILGFSFAALFEVVALFLLCYVVRIYYHVAQLEEWVTSVRHNGPVSHSFTGVWGEIAADISHLHHIYQKDKQRLQAVVQRVQNMTSALEDGVVLIDRRANVEWWNQVAEKLFELRDIDKGHRLENIIRHPQFVAYFDSEEYADPLVIEGLRREQQFLEFRIHPFGAGERLLIVREITRVKKLEQMRKDFVANVSHELRTPLTVIRGYIETMGDMPGLPTPLERALKQMAQQGQRMTNLINDLITLSRLETDNIDNTLERVAIAPLIDTILSDAKALSDNGKHTLQRSGGDKLFLLGNPNQLQSAISNLVFNAVKYSPSGCQITVEIKTFGNELLVSVIDNGVGIDAKHLPRLTERFYRVDDGRSSDMGGTGLGLAIVKHVLFKHEAELRIRSRLGKGSSFCCHFPLTRVVDETQDNQIEAPLKEATLDIIDENLSPKSPVTTPNAE